ncbi:MAG: hypothetical protein HN350_16620 [Phycisphaerales bacterium]|jgi:hypothetical protein|nr:hypothetical protein [Phycisphaerales bacterium]
MPIWLQVVFCIVCTIQIPFAAWIVCKIIAFEKDLAALRERVKARENESAERLGWLRGVDAKIDLLTENVAQIMGFLKGILVRKD